jgi:hypothetical protein
MGSLGGGHYFTGRGARGWVMTEIKLEGARPPRAQFPAPPLETLALVALRKEFDEGVEPDSRGRLCSPFRIPQGQRVALLAHDAGR